MGLPDGATVGDLADEVYRLYPGIVGNPKRLVVAVNQEYRDHASLLSGSDEVALIPPVSGGAMPLHSYARGRLLTPGMLGRDDHD